MENIQVLVRVRPSNQAERETNDIEIWSIQNNDTITISSTIYHDLVRQRKFPPGQRVEFCFNQCFDSNKPTVFVYESQIKRIVLSALQGINGTVFMYGQTGSGKTFTMLGSQRPKNDLPPLSNNPHRPIPSLSQRNGRNNSHRSPSQKAKDRTPQRHDSFQHQSHDSEGNEDQIIKKL